MLATKDLRAEHVLSIRMLGVMEAMAGARKWDGAAEQSDVERILRFLSEFVDRCHHTKEEVVLFPALQRIDEDGPQLAIRQLMTEHEAGRAGVQRLAAMADRLRQGEPGAGEDLAWTMLVYAAFLREHIRLEEECCFDLADEKLPQAAQEAMAEEYERIEREMSSEALHEEYAAMLDDLEARRLELQAI